MQTYDAITGRHGVLRYRPDVVEPEKIEKILQAAIAAPSPANSQPWTFFVVTDPTLTHELAHYLMEMQTKHVFGDLLQITDEFNEHLMKLYDVFDQTPCFIVICREVRADLGGGEFNEVMRDWDLLCLGAAMSNLMVMATDLGLGTRWFGGILMDGGASGLKAMLDIPSDIEVLAVTPLGYHDEATKARPAQTLENLTEFERGDKYKLAALLNGKLPLETVLHHDRYQKEKR